MNVLVSEELPIAPARESVHHPAHYGGVDNPYETIKVLAVWLTEEQLFGFCCGNTLKYLSRAGKKGDRVEDCKKALWYLNYLVERTEKAK